MNWEWKKTNMERWGRISNCEMRLFDYQNTSQQKVKSLLNVKEGRKGF